MTVIESIADYKEYLAHEKSLAESRLDGLRMYSWLDLGLLPTFECREVQGDRRQLRERIRDFEGASRVIEEYLD